MSVPDNCEKNSDILPVSMHSISRLLILDISCRTPNKKKWVSSKYFIDFYKRVKLLEAWIILLNKSVDSFLGRNHGELLLVESVHVDRSILNIHLASV